MSSVEKELKAIESEFSMSKGDDPCRMLQVLQSSTTDRDHIFNRFMWGNNKSLRNNSKAKADIKTLVDDLREWFNAHYSADRMKLAI